MLPAYTGVGELVYLESFHGLDGKGLPGTSGTNWEVSCSADTCNLRTHGLFEVEDGTFIARGLANMHLGLRMLELSDLDIYENVVVHVDVVTQGNWNSEHYMELKFTRYALWERKSGCSMRSGKAMIAYIREANIAVTLAHTRRNNSNPPPPLFHSTTLLYLVKQTATRLK